MATISSPGIGSGLDVKSIVSQLVALEKRPLDTLKVQAATVETKISAFGQVKSLVSTLSDAASKLSSVTGWNNVTATSSNEAAVTASAIGGTMPTSFSVEVGGLAKAQAQASGVLIPVGGMLGNAKLRIELGQWSLSQAAFMPRMPSSPVDIDITSDDTLASVASKINGASLGITATIITIPNADGQGTTGERLLLRGTGTGADAAFELSVTDEDLGDSFDPSKLLPDPVSITRPVDARATINGIEVTSSTNTFTNAVSGVTFKALKVTDPGAPVEISVAKDNSAVQQNIEAFVKAYNDINGLLSEATKYDPGTKVAGLLQGDSTAIALQNALRAAVQSVSSNSSVFRSLSDIGVSQQRGGNLTIDAGKLSKALEQPNELKAMFRGADVLSDQGIAVRIKNVTTALLGSDGFFNTKQSSLERMLAVNAKEQDRVNARANSVETQLNRKYSALDSRLSGLKALNDYVSQQVMTWNSSSK